MRRSCYRTAALSEEVDDEAIQRALRGHRSDHLDERQGGGAGGVFPRRAGGRRRVGDLLPHRPPAEARRAVGRAARMGAGGDAHPRLAAERVLLRGRRFRRARRAGARRGAAGTGRTGPAARHLGRGPAAAAAEDRCRRAARDGDRVVARAAACRAVPPEQAADRRVPRRRGAHARRPGPGDRGRDRADQGGGAAHGGLDAVRRSGSRRSSRPKRASRIRRSPIRSSSRRRSKARRRRSAIATTGSSSGNGTASALSSSAGTARPGSGHAAKS